MIEIYLVGLRLFPPLRKFCLFYCLVLVLNCHIFLPVTKNKCLVVGSAIPLYYRCGPAKIFHHLWSNVLFCFGGSSVTVLYSLASATSLLDHYLAQLYYGIFWLHGITGKLTCPSGWKYFNGKTNLHVVFYFISNFCLYVYGLCLHRLGSLMLA